MSASPNSTCSMASSERMKTPVMSKYSVEAIFSVSSRERSERSLSTTATLTFLISMVVAQGKTSITSTGRAMTMKRMKESLAICLNSFSMRYLSIIACP